MRPLPWLWLNPTIFFYFNLWFESFDHQLYMKSKCIHKKKKRKLKPLIFLFSILFPMICWKKTVCLKWSNHYYHKIVNDLESWIIFFFTIIIQVVFHVLFFLPGDMFVFPLDTFDNIPNQFIFMGFFLK